MRNMREIKMHMKVVAHLYRNKKDNLEDLDTNGETIGAILFNLLNSCIPKQFQWGKIAKTEMNCTSGPNFPSSLLFFFCQPHNTYRQLKQNYMLKGQFRPQYMQQVTTHHSRTYYGVV